MSAEKAHGDRMRQVCSGVMRRDILRNGGFVENYLCENNLILEMLSGISTDPGYVNKRELIHNIESINNTSNGSKREDLIIIHCLIHQKYLCSQVLSMYNHVMQVVIKNSELHWITSDFESTIQGVHERIIF